GVLRVRLLGTPGNGDATTLARELLDDADDGRRVDDEQPVGPRHHGFDGTFLGVAGAVRESLDSALALTTLLGGVDAVDTGTARVVDRHVGVHGLVAQPATPRLAFADFSKGAHGVERYRSAEQEHLAAASRGCGAGGARTRDQRIMSPRL